MNVEAANEVDPKYQLNPCSIISVQVRVADLWVGVVWACIVIIVNKMLSYRRETALQGALQFLPEVEDWNWETIFYGHYRSIFNHSDIIGRKIYQIR